MSGAPPQGNYWASTGGCGVQYLDPVTGRMVASDSPEGRRRMTGIAQTGQQYPRHQGMILGAMQRHGGMLPDAAEELHRIHGAGGSTETFDQLQGITGMAVVADKVALLASGIAG